MYIVLIHLLKCNSIIIFKLRTFLYFLFFSLSILFMWYYFCLLFELTFFSGISVQKYLKKNHSIQVLDVIYHS